MADKDFLNSSIDDFELPPLPKRPAKLIADDEALPEIKSDSTLSSDALPNAAAANRADEVDEITADDDFDLPPLPAKNVSSELDSVAAGDERKAKKMKLPDADSKAAAEDMLDGIGLDDDFELPPLPQVKKPEPTEDNIEVYEEDKAVQAAEAAAADEEVFDFDDDYDLDSIDKSSIILEDMTKNVAPLRTGEEESARNMKEIVKLNDMAMDIGATPVLDDLSDEYRDLEVKAADLRDLDNLTDDEKRMLKTQLAEDLGKRPENFNARASQRMYNKLMEQKQLKIAKKGMALSFIPIILGLVSAVIAFTQLGWGGYTFIKYISFFMVIAALILLVRSKHTKLFAITIYAVTLLVYVGPGLILYIMNPIVQQSNDKIVHIAAVVAAVACNVAAISILQKNEAINTYYSSKFTKK